MLVGKILPFRFPGYKDPDKYDKITVSNLNFGKASGFMLGKYPTFIINPTSLTSHVGSFPISITLKDNNTFS